MSAAPTSAQSHPAKVFLCHGSGDKPAVRELYRRLTSDGFRPWLDEEELIPGQRWETEIRKAVRESDVVLVCLSQRSASKEGFVQKEIRFALDTADEKPEGTIYVIPVRLEECEIPERLAQWQWVNIYEETGYARLLVALRLRAGQRQGVPPQPRREPELAEEPAAVPIQQTQAPGTSAMPAKRFRWAVALAAVGLIVAVLVWWGPWGTPRESLPTTSPPATDQQKPALESSGDQPATHNETNPARPPVNPSDTDRQKTAEAARQEGDRLRHAGQHKEAVAAYTRAIDLSPTADAYFGRAWSYDEFGEYREVIQDLDQAIQLKPDYEIAYVNRGNAYLNLSQYERAIRDYDKAIQLVPDDEDAYNNRGSAYRNLSQYERAIQDYDKAIQLKPDYAIAYQNRSYAKDKLNDKAGAEADRAKAKDLGYKP
jgi:tetratricopeptide (TPR) repeat protein